MSGYIVVAVLAVCTVGIIWRGYVLSIVWAWFMVGTFGLPALSVAQAIGVALVGSALTHRYVPSTKGGSLEPIADMVFAPLLILAAAWVVRGFL